MSQNFPEDFASQEANDAALGNITDAGVALVEGILNPILSGTVIDNIPVIGLITSLFKTGVAVHEAIFINKLNRFLIGLSSVTQVEKQAFSEEMRRPDYMRRVGENLIVILDKLDDLEKANLIGRFFGFYTAGIMDYEQYRRYAQIIDRSYLPDLKILTSLSGAEDISLFELNRIQMGALYALGISSMPVGTELESSHRDYHRLGTDKSSTTVWLTELGKTFRDLMMRPS